MDALTELAAAPERAAILLDVDGVLAPIVARPEDARVPDEARAELRRLARRYALVACISGREGADARRIVGVPELVYAGNHGLELEPEAAGWSEPLRRLLAGVDWPELEDKGLSVSLHYRTAPDQTAAHERLEKIAAQARAAGFVARFGRKVLEILPPVHADKGTAVRRLLTDRGLSRALYAGDDTTDLDAFAALAELELAIRVAVASAEGPQALIEAADLVVGSPGELLQVLAGL